MNGSGRMRSVGRLLSTALVAMGVLWPTLGGAQTEATGTPTGAGAPPQTPSVDVVAPTPPPHRPAPEFGFERTFPPDQPRENDFYPERTRSVHDPAFVSGASTTVRTSRHSGVRVGLSGWTAPRVPFDFQESSGGVAFGLSIVWGVPMPDEATGLPQAETPSDR